MFRSEHGCGIESSAGAGETKTGASVMVGLSVISVISGVPVNTTAAECAGGPGELEHEVDIVTCRCGKHQLKRVRPSGIDNRRASGNARVLREREAC